MVVLGDGVTVTVEPPENVPEIVTIPARSSQVVVLAQGPKGDAGAAGAAGATGATGPAGTSDGFTNVKDAPYSATGNGSTDDTTAIHAARTAAGVGGRIFFPVGTYITTGLSFNLASQEIVLAPGATIKLKNASTAYAVSLSGTGSSFTGGKVDGNRTNQTGSGNGCIDVFGTNITVRGVEVTASREHGIVVESPGSDCLITGNYVHDNGHQGNGIGGIYVNNAPRNRILANRCHDNGDYGTGDSTYDGDGIKVQGTSGASASERNIIANNVSYHNARRGVKIQNTLAVITGNELTDNGGAGVGVVGGTGHAASSGVISGNVLSDNLRGLQIDTAGDWTISGNYISDSRDHGGTIADDVVRLNIVGNLFTRSQKHGLLVTGLKDSQFNGNSFIDNGQGGVNTFGLQFADDGVTGKCERISVVGNRSENSGALTTQTHGFVLSGTSDRFQMVGNTSDNGVSVAFSIAGTTTNVTRYAEGPAGGGQQWSSFLMGPGTVIDTDNTTGFQVGGNSSRKVGFWGATPIARPAVTGVRTEPTGPVTSLLSQLAAAGLITDSTTSGYRVVTTTQTLTTSDGIVIANGSSITISLPDPTTVTSGTRILTVKNIHTTSLTVNSAGTSKTIDGAASIALARWDNSSFLSDGSDWLTI